MHSGISKPEIFAKAEISVVQDSATKQDNACNGIELNGNLLVKVRCNIAIRLFQIFISASKHLRPFSF